MHRDIKPSNILITPDGLAKLVDMGLARLEQLEQTEHDETATGVTLGTFDYISPEQARNPRDADIRSDIYSLGCTLFFMLTGRPPFPEGTVLQKAAAAPGRAAAGRAAVSARRARTMLAGVLGHDAGQAAGRAIPDAGRIGGRAGRLHRQLGHRPATRRAARVLVELVADRTARRRHAPWLVPDDRCLLASVLGLALWWNTKRRHPSFRSCEFPQPRHGVRSTAAQRIRTESPAASCLPRS